MCEGIFGNGFIIQQCVLQVYFALSNQRKKDTNVTYFALSNREKKDTNMSLFLEYMRFAHKMENY
jgi:hypothetical protein